MRYFFFKRWRALAGAPRNLTQTSLVCVCAGQIARNTIGSGTRIGI
jgi:hypothetical protein